LARPISKSAVQRRADGVSRNAEIASATSRI